MFRTAQSYRVRDGRCRAAYEPRFTPPANLDAARQAALDYGPPEQDSNATGKATA